MDGNPDWMGCVTLDMLASLFVPQFLRHGSGVATATFLHGIWGCIKGVSELLAMSLGALSVTATKTRLSPVFKGNCCC